ncbi:unnamed protein product, partial [Amoebophrya sp. A25]|eukprot:GSA25T00026478001.1
MAALDEICIRKELNVKEKRSLSLLWLYPVVCSVCPRELLESTLFGRLVLHGILTDPDATLAARVLVEGFVILNKQFLASLGRFVQSPRLQGRLSLSSLGGLDGSQAVQDATPWSVELYHRYSAPIFKAVSQGSNSILALSSSGSGQNGTKRASAAHKSLSELQSPRRNLKSPRDPVKISPQLCQEQLETQTWSGSLALICLTRELLLQYTEDRTNFRLRELLMEHCSCLFDALQSCNEQGNELQRKESIHPLTTFKRNSQTQSSRPSTASGMVKSSSDTGLGLSSRTSRSSFASPTRGKFPSAGSLAAAVKLNGIALLGLLHCVAQYLAKHLWPRRYLLQ